MLTGERWRAGGDLRAATTTGLLIGLWVGAVLVAANAAVYYIGGGGVGMDAHAYWLAGLETHPYHAAPEHADAFLYSPLFAQAMRPLALLPWPVFCGLLLTVEAGTYWWLLRPLTWRWRVPALLLVLPELLIGNIYALLAAALVVAVTRPEALAFPALTKITPASVGVVWHASRGDWRAVARAALATVGLAGISYALAPHLWVEWARFLLHNGGHGGIEVIARTVLGCVLAVVAARTDRRWLLGLGYFLAMPLAGLGIQTMATLSCIPRLVMRPAAGTAAPATTDVVAGPRSAGFR
ncbi:MAG: glycosyltransferase 87 family protein [Nocardioidaceae bacterium]